MTTVATTVAEPTRRDFLFIATGAVGAVGVASAIWPFISQMAPDAATVAAGAPVEFDLAPIAEGQIVKLFWRGKLIFVRHRTADEIKTAENTPLADLKDPEADSARVQKGHAQWLVVYGNCTHPGLRAARQRGPLPRLDVPLPRLDLRHVPGASARDRRRRTCRSRLTPFLSDTKIQIG